MAQEDWSPLYETTSSLYLFALGTQCLLAWIFCLLFGSVARAAARPAFFDPWRRAWLARALGLSAILVRFGVPMLQGARASSLNGTVVSFAGYWIYQASRFLYAWWLLEGALRFVDAAPRRGWSRFLPPALSVLAGASVLVFADVNDFMLAQAPVMMASGVATAIVLLRAPADRRGLGTRLTTLVLLGNTALWVLYVIAFSRQEWGPWPVVRTFWALVAFHNSYFDLLVDVLTASGMVVLLLQDAQRRQAAAEVERARLRDELGRTERLRSLGKLVSGVAHELNNPLTAILGFAEAIDLPGEDGQRARYAQVIREQALRCRRIVRGLSTFSGKESEMLERVDVREVLERVARGFELELSQHGVRLELSTAGLADGLLGDRFALEQLFTNLLSNAVQASPRGARVWVRARTTADDLEVEVEDEGPGIPRELLEQIFDPFFTTKVPGEGMGLGLAVVHGIVHAHAGRIRAENRAPSGARFVVVLPLRAPSRGEPEPPERDVPRPVRPSGAPLSLLVVDDERTVREMLVTLGARRGWRVTCVDGGAAALERLRRGEPFDVVLCDLRMPSPSGIELHDRLQREQPRLLERFLFVTGDLASMESSGFARRCQRPIVSKPFHFEELARVIEETAAAQACSG